ncbi:hypothetical protein [Desulfotomaculum sp. 1211_IL3151]|uniref:hypothetical protein n=1 Tax=Desulfotomaculum sp. 1211_IL3151 TaxID=3084055 RepID=UPI002FD8DE80
MRHPISAIGLKLSFLWVVLLLPGILGIFKGAGLPDLQNNYWTHLMPWGKSQTIEAIVLALIFTAVFFLYWQAIKASHRSSLFEIAAWTLLFTVILIFLFPFACEDIYYYTASGQLQHSYQENPYLKTPHQITGWQGDPFLSTTGWGFLLNPYGPLWNMVTSWLVSLASDKFWLAIFLFKAFAGFIHMINLLLIGFTANKLNIEPARAMVVYGWNPLLLFELPGHAHNDALLLTFLILTFTCVATKKLTLTLPLLTLSALVKYTTVLLGPLIGLWLLCRKKYLIMVLSALLSVLALLLIWSPYWVGFETLAGLGRQMNFYSIKSLHYLLFKGLSQWFATIPGPQAFKISSQFFLIIFGVIYSFILYRLWYNKSTANIGKLIKLSIVIFILYLLVINKWFQPWYFCWLIPLIALYQPSPIFAVALLLSYTAELSRVPQLLCQNTGPMVQLLTVIITWLPLLAYVFIRKAWLTSSLKCP